jgi:Arm DNA-binding domain
MCRSAARCSRGTGYLAISQIDTPAGAHIERVADSGCKTRRQAIQGLRRARPFPFGNTRRWTSLALPIPPRRRREMAHLGAYPDVSLKRAREKRDDAQRHVADGVDPSAKRRAERDAATNTFVAVADEWLLTKKNALTPGLLAARSRPTSQVGRSLSSQPTDCLHRSARVARSPQADRSQGRHQHRASHA